MHLGSWVLDPMLNVSFSETLPRDIAFGQAPAGNSISHWHGMAWPCILSHRIDSRG